MGQADRTSPVRKPRRAVRSATDGVPEGQRDMIEEPPSGEESPGDDEKAQTQRTVPDAWWHEQRPPHWG